MLVMYYSIPKGELWYNIYNLDITEIEVVDKGLRYFPDVSCFASLRMVDCSNNQLTSLDLPNATEVDYGNNPDLFLEDIIAPNWNGIDSVPQRMKNQTPSNNPNPQASSSSSLSVNNQREPNDSCSIS